MFRKVILILGIILFTLGSIPTSNNIYADKTSDAIDKREEEKERADKKSEDQNKNSEGDFRSSDFKINVSGGIGKVGGSGPTGSTSTQKMNNEFGKIIKNLMIGLGMVSMALIIVGAGYILSNAGQDELLTKGKNIVMGGIMALIIALSGYFLIDAIRYILYK